MAAGPAFQPESPQHHGSASRMLKSEARKKITETLQVWNIEQAIELFDAIVPYTMKTTVSHLNAHPDWPIRGSITFIRDADQKRIRFYRPHPGAKVIAIVRPIKPTPKLRSKRKPRTKK